MLRSNRTLKEHASGKTQSELFFEKYLELQGVEFDFEPSASGKRKCPDYRLKWDGHAFYCEVKELHEKQPAPKGAASFEPYSGIREKIHKARKQFREYKEFPCVLVIQNIDDWEFRDWPHVILGAMLGDLGIQFPVDLKKGVALTDQAKDVFLDGGKMLDPKEKTPRNTTISAIGVLNDFTIPNLEFEQEYEDRIARYQQESGTELTIEQRLSIRRDMYKSGSPSLGKIPRVNLFENPFAHIKLTNDVFQGHYDTRHRFNQQRGKIERVFAGAGLIASERKESDRMDVLQRIERFKQGVIEFFNPERIYLFGSHAYGCPEPGSDVDLLVVFPGKEAESHRSLDIRKKLAPDFPLDLLTRSSGEIKRRLALNDHFMREIIDCGKLLYEA